MLLLLSAEFFLSIADFFTVADWELGVEFG
jgi:hypothetical protein